MVDKRRRVGAVIERFFSPFRKSQRKTIRDMAAGLMERGKVGLAQIARGMDFSVSVRHHIKRAWRFARNEAVSVEKATMCLVRWLAPGCGELVVAVDWTHLPKGYVMLSAKIAVCSRAVPIAWKVMSQGQFDEDTKSRNDAEEQLIGRLIGAMGENPWILVADRGFARADLIGKLQDWGVRFVIRAVGNTWADGWGFSCLLDNVPRKPNRIRRYEEVFYQKTRGVPVSLVVAHRDPAPEPWYLVTNLEGTREIASIYQKRMWIDESFRDAKSNLGVDRLWLATPDRMERLLIVVAIVMALAVLVALEYRRKHGLGDPQLSTKKRSGTLSVFRMGLELIRRHGPPRNIASTRLFIVLEDS